jgi:hypothetical protein
MEVFSSFFVNIRSRDACLKCAHGELTVKTTGFLKCDTTLGPSWGAAIGHLGDEALTVSKCCFEYCRSHRVGMAIDVGSISGANITQSDFAMCGGSNIADSNGTIFQERPMTSFYEYLNFSACALSLDSGFGSAIAPGLTWGSSETTLVWKIQYSTFWKCSGNSILHCCCKNWDSGSTRPTIRMCNFFSNVIRSNGSIVYSEYLCCEIIGCVFGGGTQSSSALFGHPSIASSIINKFFIFGSVFASEPSSDIAKCVRDCSTNDLPTSIDIPLFEMQCTLSGDNLMAAPLADPPDESTCTRITTDTLWPIRKGCDTACVIVEDSVFRDILTSDWNGANGGGLLTECASGSLFVRRTTFRRVQIVGSGYGGDICTYASLCEIDSCCFFDGSVDDGHGAVLALRGESGSRADITNSNCFSCGLDGFSKCVGTIFVETGYAIEYSFLNFTECRYKQIDWGTAVAFYYNADTGSWTFDYCTVVECVGAGVIRSHTTTRGNVGYCNFYDNDLDWCHLYSTSTGMDVNSCIFTGTSLYIYIESIGSDLFDITNCVFSDSLPDGAYWESNDANFAGITTASRALVHFDPENCHGESPPPTPLPTPTPTCHVYSGEHNGTLECWFVATSRFTDSGINRLHLQSLIIRLSKFTFVAFFEN